MSRRDDTPTDPRAAAAWQEIAERARKRSTDTTKLAALARMELRLIDGVEFPTLAESRIDEAINKWMRSAIDKVQFSLMQQVETLAAENSTLTSKLRELEAERDTLKARTEVGERERVSMVARINRLEGERADLKAQVRLEIRRRSEER